jgi:hypothetical protein
VPSLSESLHRVLSVEGAAAAAIIDARTGMIIDAAGSLPAGLPPDAAASLAEEARVASAALGPAQPGGPAEELLALTTSRIHLIRVLSRWQGDGLLLYVDLDRGQTNLALAAQQVARAAAAVLA